MRSEGTGDEPHTFAIHEVYDDGGWTERPTDVSSESVDGLREMLALMALAFEVPVLDYESGAPVEPGGA